MKARFLMNGEDKLIRKRADEEVRRFLLHSVPADDPMYLLAVYASFAEQAREYRNEALDELLESTCNYRESDQSVGSYVDPGQMATLSGLARKTVQARLRNIMVQFGERHGDFTRVREVQG